MNTCGAVQYSAPFPQLLSHIRIVPLFLIIKRFYSQQEIGFMGGRTSIRRNKGCCAYNCC